MMKRILTISILALAFAACGDDGSSSDTGIADSGTPDAADGMVSCPMGTEDCDGTCADLDVDRANCGACGTACATGEACVDGACGVFCPSGQVECDGVCVDTDTNRANCGACGTACEAGEICADGACALSCPAGQEACGDECVASDSDPRHCGACDAACGAGQVCNEGTCEGTCAAGLVECGGACVDTDTSPLHCGACDTACEGASGATGVCISGSCAISCDAFEGDCNGDLADSAGDGCETPLETDVMNCGACRRECALDNAIAGCTSGACSITDCDDGFDDCDGMTANGCEADVTEDALNCGACGTVCAAGESCLGSTCTVTGGEDCADALALTTGTNTLYWVASTVDYLTTTPSCVSVGNIEGPDVVLSYTSTVDEAVTISVTKPTSNRWVMQTSTEACGTLTSASCTSEFSAATMEETLTVPAGETVYIYIADTSSGSAPLDSPLIVDVTPTIIPCLPGSGGVIGNTQTRVPSGLTTSFSEYYVAADDSATGYVYAGGLSDLYRLPKAGGTAEDVAMAAGLSAAELGYTMLIDGTDIYTIDNATTGRTGRVFRITTDGGTTWNREEYIAFPYDPSDDIRGATAHGGRIYFVTEEDTSGVDTEIWSAQAGAITPPVAAALEITVTGEGDCTAIARDDMFYYLLCDDGGDRLVRVPVAGGASELVTSNINISGTAGALYGDDLDADGVFDVLYAQTWYEEIYYVCDPAGAMPFAATLADTGGSSSNYGMGYDRTNNVLWTIDDDNREFISVQ